MRAIVKQMAIELALPCTFPGGCSALVKGGGRCPNHRGGRWRPQQPKESKAARKKRIYNLAVWDRMRALVLAKEPLCRACSKKGLSRLARAVDHIVDVSAGGAPFDEANLQPLCISCHNSKTARTFGTPLERQRGPAGAPGAREARPGPGAAATGPGAPTGRLSKGEGG